MENTFSLRRILNTAPAQAEGLTRVNIAADGSIEQEGQLAVDVYQDMEKVVIVAPLAGVDPRELSLKISEDVLTIEGTRKKPSDLPADELLVQECFWGKFSRSIILPMPTDNSRISAKFKDGVLRISIPKTANLRTKVIHIET